MTELTSNRFCQIEMRPPQQPNLQLDSRAEHVRFAYPSTPSDTLQRLRNVDVTHDNDGGTSTEKIGGYSFSVAAPMML